MSNKQQLPHTLGELARDARYSEARLGRRSVKDEMREHLIERLRAKEVLFPGIVGYDDTVIPQIVNAILSRQNFILLGLRGQAKSRILRALTTLLDETIPYIEGCEIRDNPYAPLCKACRERVATQGDSTPIAWLPREQRYVEKLATPDVTVADLIGDLDPIKAARSGEQLSNEMNIHYGLLPRANRGIFALNELPDLAGKIQVALFNIMQEGDVQIKGYPVRLALDVALIFSANPEDYTARGKIVTPLKDRIGSEIRTHYPLTLVEGITITSQEAWTERGLMKTEIPGYIRSIVEQIAFVAREDKKVDRRSGVSQRLPISTLELVVSNAERRAIQHGESLAVPRAGDLYSALPGITGKIELEYEGEMRGPEIVVREIVRQSIAEVFDHYFAGISTLQIEQWFNLGGNIKMQEDQSAAAMLAELEQVQGLMETLVPLGIHTQDAPERIVSAAEFLLEGMVAHRRISRNEERGFIAPEKYAHYGERAERGGERSSVEHDPDDLTGRRGRKVYN